MPRGDVLFFFGGSFLLGILSASFSAYWIWAALPLCAIFAQKFNFKISLMLTGIFVLGFLYFLFLPNFLGQPLAVQPKTANGFVLQGFKSRIINIYQKNFTGDAGALLSGIMLGARADFSQELKLAMQGSGTTHLVALSGYNIAVLMLAVAFFLGRFLKRNRVFWITALTVVVFVLMVGTGASVVRAAIMGFLALLAGQVGRKYDFRNSAILAAVAMVVFEPRVLRFDLGFQLSFAALLGISYFMPALQKILGWSGDNLSSIKEQALTTFSAELAVMPFIVFNFSYFSVFGILANLLLLWLVPPLMFLGFIFSILSLLAEPLGLALSWLMQILLAYMLAVIKFFGRFSLPLNINFTVFMALYFIAVGSIFYFAYAKRRI